tara:strand:+ start:234 stop:1445 length:1212 start_codon:yes stop_codon:yes gene_type:complete
MVKKIIKEINLPAVALSYFALFSLAIIENSKSPIYPNLLKEFSLTHQQGSWVFTLASILGIVATATSKYWLSKYGIFKAKKYLASFLVVGTLLSALALNNFHYFSLFLLGCAFIGFAMGGLSITMNLIIDENVPAKWRRQAFSGLHSLYGLASFFSPAVIILIVNLGFTWQKVFHALIVFPILLIIFSRNKKLIPSIKNDMPQEGSSLNNSFSEKESDSFSIKKVLPFAFLLSFYVCGEVILSSRFRVFTQAIWPLDEETSQSYLASFFAFLTLGRIVFVFLKVPFSNRVLLSSSLAFSLLFIYVGVNFDPIGFSLIGLSMSIYFPCALDLISESFPKNVDKALPYVLNVIAIMLLGAHFLIGTLTDYYGNLAIIYAATIFLSLALMFVGLSIYQPSKLTSTE